MKIIVIQTRRVSGGWLPLSMWILTKNDPVTFFWCQKIDDVTLIFVALPHSRLEVEMTWLWRLFDDDGEAYHLVVNDSLQRVILAVPTTSNNYFPHYVMIGREIGDILGQTCWIGKLHSSVCTSSSFHWMPLRGPTDSRAEQKS